MVADKDWQRNVRTTRRTENTLSLSGQEIIGMLRDRGFDVPDHASVSITVPGGGDWSNTTMEITREHPVEVSFVTIEESTEP